MIISNITLKNFRRREEISLDLTPGLNVFRGRNEIGKSTVMQGFLYCLFGAKALAEPLADVVTWGKEPASLRTSVSFNTEDHDYVCNRSKNSAEILKDGKVACSGQKQTVEYIEELFHIPSKTAHLLMVAEQGDIKGILKSGNAAEFIENLADFSEIDHLIDAIKTKLETGAVGPYRTVLEDAQARLAQMIDPVKPDRTILDELEEKAKVARETFNKVQLECDVQKKIQNEARNTQIDLDNLRSDLKSANNSLAMLEEELKNLNPEVLDPKAKAALQKEIQEMEEQNLAAVVAKNFTFLPTYPEIFWEGSEEGFTKEFDKVSTHVSDSQKSIGKLTQQLAVAKAKWIKDKTCPTCHQEVPGVEKNNKETQQEIEHITAQINADQECLRENLNELEDMNSLIEIQSTYLEWLKEYPDRIQVDKTNYPYKLSWPNPPQEVDTAGYVRAVEALKEIKLSEKIAERNQARLVTVNTEIKRKKEVIKTTEKLIGGIEVPNLTLIEAILSNLNIKLEAEHHKCTEIETKINTERSQYNLALQSYENVTKNKSDVEAQVKKARKSLSELEENNALLKAVREARIAVTDHIWNLVLTGITQNFSKMRGEFSVITKEDGDFRCGGKSIHSLSGSTLDILGLALRFALTKMFLPGVGIQVLDEPASGCDAERSNLLMGFVKTAGFPQTWVVTHSDGDEILADNLVYFED